MELFDILKAKAFLPVNDAEAVLFARATPRPIEHYGIRIDKSEPDTAARITYLFDAAGFTPAVMDTASGIFSYGSWANAFFIRNNYPVMCRYDGTEDYRLDPADHAKKLDGSASDVANLSYSGNAMSCFACRIWMKFYEDDSYCYLEVANKRLDKDFVDYPYIRADGTRADRLYFPMYPGYVDSEYRLRSISGVKATGNTTAAQEVAYAQNNGANWMIGDWSHYLWLHSLMLLISKNFNSQAAFGNGNVSGSYSASGFSTNGILNTSGQFSARSGIDKPMKAFYCENVYGNRYQRLLGLYNDKGTYRIRMTPPYTYDGTFPGYKAITAPAVPVSDGFLQDMAFSKAFGILPRSTGASKRTYVGDYFWQWSSDTTMPMMGGHCSNGDDSGSWNMNMNTLPTRAIWMTGASPYLIQP